MRTTQAKILSSIQQKFSKLTFVQSSIAQNAAAQKSLRLKSKKKSQVQVRTDQNYSKVENFLVQEQNWIKSQKKELGERELFLKTKETQISAQTEALGKLHQESETLAQEKQFLLRQQVVKAAIDSKNFLYGFGVFGAEFWWCGRDW